MKKFFATKLLAVLPLTFALNVFANEVTAMNVKLISVSVIGATPTGGHPPGNMEIRVPAGSIPGGVTCPGNQANEYITWKISTDPDRAMFRVLSDAIVGNKSVNLRISDNPSLTAWSGRCSLVAAGVNYN